jgi:hypothetical protein
MQNGITLIREREKTGGSTHSEDNLKLLTGIS